MTDEEDSDGRFTDEQAFNLAFAYKEYESMTEEEQKKHPFADKNGFPSRLGGLARSISHTTKFMEVYYFNDIFQKLLDEYAETKENKDTK